LDYYKENSYVRLVIIFISVKSGQIQVRSLREIDVLVQNSTV